MEWPSALAGFALGLLSSYLILRVQRSWQRKDDAIYTEKVIHSLIVEISGRSGRAKYMASLADQREASFGRIYTALWESTVSALLQLSQILRFGTSSSPYYRFDLINFNCEAGRPESGGAFAKQYLGEIEGNLAKLKARLRVN
jgi:hypothetical protein